MPKAATKLKPQSDDEGAAFHGVQAIGEAPEMVGDAAELPESGGSISADALQVLDAPGELPSALTAATIMPRLIPLSKLVLADKNVRRGGKADLEQLAADILAHGVLQNLVGTVVDSGPRIPGASGEGFGAAEKVQIVAGGRRLRALELRKRQGKIDGDHLVPVQIVPGDASREASLAENFQRLPMGAGEEVEAFGRLADLEGLDAAAIAARFGLTVQHVKQRLRLAGLAAPVLAALKDRKITLEVAQAFASVPDQARQEAVWKENKGNRYLLGTPNEVRRQMANAAKKADSVEARFVGEAAYLAAGGRIEADLFTPGEAALWLDGALVLQLARERMVVEAEEIQQRDGWGRVYPTLGWVDRNPIAADLVEFETELMPDDIAEADRAGLVVFTNLQSDGQDGWQVALAAKLYLLDASVPEGLRQAQPERDLEHSEPDESEDGAADEAEEPEEVDKAAAIPAHLRDCLAMQRRDYLALGLMDDLQMARDAALFLLINATFTRADPGKTGSNLTTDRWNHSPDPLHGAAVHWDESPLSAELETARTHPSAAGGAGYGEKLDDGWLHLKSITDRWAAFLELPVAERLHWGAVALGRTLLARRDSPEFHEALAASLGLAGPGPALWRPDLRNYFDSVSKARCLRMLEDCFDGLLETTTWAKWKKPDLAAACAALAQGDSQKLGGLGGADRAAIESRGRDWLPPEMQFSEMKGVA